MSNVALLAVLLALVFDARPVSAATGVFREQAIPGSPAGATEVVRGPDGGFWFTEFDGNRIGTLSRDGQYREFNVPTPDSGPRGIASTFDAIWFTELKAGKIGRLTTAGVFTEYVLPSPQSRPWGIAFAFVSGAIWFTEAGANRIGRLVPDGTVTEFLIPTSDSEPRGIASGDFGLPCFAEFNANQIACMDGNGRIVERPLPTPNSGPEAVANMTNLGNLWFTETRGNRIGVIRFFNASSFLDARIEEFLIPTSASGPAGLAAEYDEGSAWFAEVVIELIDPDGHVLASRDETVGAGRSVYLVDVIGGLGVGSFPDGQLRVRKSGDRGLPWGYLATVDVNGAFSLFSGLNP